MAKAADVEAGRAYVTFYLRRVNYDQQVDQLERDNKQLEQQRANELPGQENRPSAAVSSSVEAGVNIPETLVKAATFGAASRFGGLMLTKVIPALRETATVAAVAAPAVASVGVAASATAPAVAATATAATAAAPAVAASGTAAAGASVGFAALATSLLPIIVPIAAIVAAAGLVYVAFAKWDKLPFWAKALLLVLSPLVVVCRALALAFGVLRLAVRAILLPFRLAIGAVKLFVNAVLAIPRAIVAIPGLLLKVGAAAWEMSKRVASAAKTMAIEIGKAVAATVATLAKVPGKLAGYASDAVEGVSSAIRGVGISLLKVGGLAAGLSAAIVGPITIAAKGWASYGEKIREVQNDLLRFQLTAEEASIVARVADQTGESTQKLAEQMRDGTRDFSRWRNELQQSGMLMSGAGLGAALGLSRAYYSLRESISGLRNALGAALGPKLQETTEVITGLIRGVTRWINANKPLVVQVFKIASAVGIAATALTTLGGVVATAGTFLTPFTAALAAIAGALAIVEVRTDAGRSVWAAYGESVRRVWDTVSTYLGQMLGFATKVIGGVKDALMAGDLATAVDVMWAGAKVAWISALMEIDRITGGTFGSIFQSLAAGRWSAAGEAAMAALRQAWIAGIGFLAGLWDDVVNAADTAWVGIQSGFDSVIAGMEKGWLGMVETLKTGLADLLQWAISSVFRPMVSWIEEHDELFGVDSGIGEKARKGFGSLLDMQGALERSRKSPKELAAEQQGVDDANAAQRAEREAGLAGRQADRQNAADAARVAREQEIETLRKRQAELARQGKSDSSADLTANQQALDAAIAAAAAARAAADAGRLKEEDFAVSQQTQSIARFSGEALRLSVGRSDDPARRTAKLSEEQLTELKAIAAELKLTLREVLRLQTMGGFA